MVVASTELEALNKADAAAIITAEQTGAAVIQQIQTECDTLMRALRAREQALLAEAKTQCSQAVASLHARRQNTAATLSALTVAAAKATIESLSAAQTAAQEALASRQPVDCTFTMRSDRSMAAGVSAFGLLSTEEALQREQRRLKEVAVSSVPSAFTWPASHCMSCVRSIQWQEKEADAQRKQNAAAAEVCALLICLNRVCPTQRCD